MLELIRLHRSMEKSTADHNAEMAAVDLLEKLTPDVAARIEAIAEGEEE